MKRLTSMLLSFVLILAFVPAAFAASTPPYSAQYLNNISGSRYAKYIDLDDITTKEYSRTQRTLEVYDVLELWLTNGCSWSTTVEPFRQAFLNAGFNESISLDENNQNQYWYGKSSDVFIILGEKASQAILNESGIIYIEHNYISIPSTPVSPTPTPEPTPTPAPVVPTPSTAQQAAQTLYERGLFSGTGKDANGNPNFDLDRAPTRHEAVTMLVRLLGKENEAKNGTWNTPFTDVAEWAKPYVGYAYTNGLTSGTSATTYGGNQIVTPAQYLTFVLRALGYQVGTDFQWDKAWELSDKIGLTNGQYNANTINFTRGDVAIISNQALHITLKGSNETLNIPAQPNNKSTNDIKAEILEIYTTGLEIQKAGLVQAKSELEKVLNGNYSATYLLSYYVVVMQSEQAQTKKAIDYWEKAINLCGTYSDTQEMKRYLEEFVDLYNEYCDYNITMNNVVEYINNYLGKINEQDSIIGEKIQGEINRWVAENA